MKRITAQAAGLKREDLARALAERFRTSGGGGKWTNGQARDELDGLVHGIVVSLRQGRIAEMPGVGPLAAKGTAPFLRTSGRGGAATKTVPERKTAVPRKSKS
jgi:hypothetical protein